MAVTLLTINEVHFWLKNMVFVKDHKRPQIKRYCRLSGELLEAGLPTVLIGCNYKVFPNALCLISAVERIGGNEAAIKKLWKEWYLYKNNIWHED